MQYLMAANWKMYKTIPQAVETAKALEASLNAAPADREVVVFAPFTTLAPCFEALGTKSKIAFGGQNCYPASEGAYTGEISPSMLKDCGCTYVLTGHSERRTIFGETDELIGAKTAFALGCGLKVVLCIGETLPQREAGALEAVLEAQLRAGLAGIPQGLPAADISIAYEPVWAIGTGKVASLEEVAEAHLFVRKCLKNILPEIGQKVRILYGGSVKPDNAGAIIALDNVNGVLVGGASLLAESFSSIIMA